MTRPDRTCKLCGSNHFALHCPWLKDYASGQEDAARSLEAALRPPCVAADTAARLAADLSSPAKGPILMKRLHGAKLAFQ